MIFLTMESPKPVPPYVRLISTEPWEKLSKIFAILSSGIPIPLSWTTNFKVILLSFSLTVLIFNMTSPFLVNLIELLIKFIKIWDSLVGSPIRFSLPFMSKSNLKLILFLLINPLKDWLMLFTNSHTFYWFTYYQATSYPTATTGSTTGVGTLRLHTPKADIELKKWIIAKVAQIVPLHVYNIVVIFLDDKYANKKKR